MGRNWAITIGINDYIHPKRLQFAKRDADLMRDFFQQELDIKTVYHFTDDAIPIETENGSSLTAAPTFTNLMHFFRIQFEKPFLKSGDNLWFFFAGHGINLDQHDYLLPIDADPEDVIYKHTWISLSFVTNRLRQSGADNVVMLIDACRDNSGIFIGSRSATVMGFGSAQQNQQGVITFFACSPKKVSYEFSQIQQGAFTYVLLESLRMEGEGNCATVERLYNRLRQVVPQITQLYAQQSQMPYGVIEPNEKSHLILLPKKANSTDILTLKYDAQQAELHQDWTLAKQAWIRVLAISIADADAIAGIERIAQQTNRIERLFDPTRVTGTWDNRVLNLVKRLFTPTFSVTGTQNNPVLTLGKQPASASSLTQPGKRKILTFRFEVVTVNAKGLVASRRPAEAQYFIEDLGKSVMLEMILIPGGNFLMGSPDGEREEREKPQHRVNIQPFAMAKYPVTQAQWQRVSKLPQLHIELNPDPSEFKGAKLPVERVTWHEAIEFCARLSAATGHNYRLPSEAEWEYACRAGTTTPFYFGETINGDFANLHGDYIYGNTLQGGFRRQTTEVGQFPPNAFGLYDMHGNVWEWCQDCFHKNYQGAPTDNSAWLSGNDNHSRILRGGSWSYFPRYCRSAYRFNDSADSRFNFFGFRLVYSSS